MKLVEDSTKQLLRSRGLPVPAGGVATTAAECAELARELGGAVAVKALVAAGRRGKAGLVKLAASPDEAKAAATDILGKEIAGRPVERLYVEKRLDIAEEFYVSFAFSDRAPKIVLSSKGGVDIEHVFETEPGSVLQADIDAARGLRPWDATELWSQAGLTGRTLPTVARLTAELYAAFVALDAQMLEINPLAIDPDGKPCLVGAMMEIDDDALFRHPELAHGPSRHASENPRERAVLEANRAYPGGDSRYTELEGDIGLLVAGGGAGLLQHDLIVGMGGRPANHSDMSPAPGTEKMEAVLDAVFTNPRARSLLIGYNYLQMAPCDHVVKALVKSVARNKVDATRFPIVLRLFGPREAEARALAATIPGIRYLPPGSSLEDGARTIVTLTEQVRENSKQVAGQ
ncbi:ATP-grasp domain-containing protein [Oceanibacterium hippocampi]|uniref:Succinyl-CoA ligase [ADP-forming] subunit beta n=1 Tax=Oceanibacterium hippocampi TaxID=745714 RepID=A0A1Y5SXT0_9PROT|nr:ATP-grasp domain-containing protein [Oceanibacterium hippocampi]SLN47625.1 Succinyl-CoA ligase [ADP-forming] subunit beta [Oceanibacterium hippocampi]